MAGRHFMMACGGLPAYGNHGGAQTCMGIVAAALNRGDRVSVLSFYDTTEANPYRRHRDENHAALTALGVDVHYVEYENEALMRESEELRIHGTRRDHLAEGLRPTLVRAYPWCKLTDEATAILSEVQPDAVFCYHFEPLAALAGYTAVPKMAGVGDPTHMIRLMQRDDVFRGIQEHLLFKLYCRRYTVLMKRLLAECQTAGAFAAHHAAWFRSVGTPVEYLRTPVADPLDDSQKLEWERRRTTGSRFRILMLGDLTGTVTRSGLTLVAQSLLPSLRQAYLPHGFELRIVGRGEPAADIRDAFRADDVTLCGCIDPADEEILNADCLLVPNSIPLGIRVRIITALSYGCPVVTHTANTEGIPELKHDENCLVGDSGESLAACIAHLASSRTDQLTIARAGRQTYETAFATDVAGAVICSQLDRISNNQPG